MGQDFFGGFAGDDFGEAVDAGALEVGDAAEFAEELAGGGWADAGDVAEGGLGLALAAAEAVEGDGETVGFVADLLDQVEYGVVAVELDGLVFLAVEVEDFFFLGDAGEGLVDDGEGFEGFGGGVELADAAVDEDQAGERFVFFEDALVAAGYGFAHGGEVVVLGVGGAGVDGDDAGERDERGGGRRGGSDSQRTVDESVGWRGIERRMADPSVPNGSVGGLTSRAGLNPARTLDVGGGRGDGLRACR